MLILYPFAMMWWKWQLASVVFLLKTNYPCVLMSQVEGHSTKKKSDQKSSKFSKLSKNKENLRKCHSLEKAMATNSSTLAWNFPWTEEPGRLQSMGSLRVGHDWATSLPRFTFMHWRRKWQPTPAFLPGESQG